MTSFFFVFFTGNLQKRSSGIFFDCHLFLQLQQWQHLLLFNHTRGKKRQSFFPLSLSDITLSSVFYKGEISCGEILLLWTPKKKSVPKRHEIQILSRNWRGLIHSTSRCRQPKRNERLWTAKGL